MNTELGDRDTVAVDEEAHAVYKQLTEGNDPISIPLKTMKDVFMWAANLGYQRGQRKPLRGKRVTVFRWAQFSPQVDVPLLKALAISDTASIEVLQDQDVILTIAEEYANAGIADLCNVLRLDSGQPLWNLLLQLRDSGG